MALCNAMFWRRLWKLCVERAVLARIILPRLRRPQYARPRNALQVLGHRLHPLPSTAEGARAGAGGMVRYRQRCICFFVSWRGHDTWPMLVMTGCGALAIAKYAHAVAMDPMDPVPLGVLILRWRLSVRRGLRHCEQWRCTQPVTMPGHCIGCTLNLSVYFSAP